MGSLPTENNVETSNQGSEETNSRSRINLLEKESLNGQSQNKSDRPDTLAAGVAEIAEESTKDISKTKSRIATCSKSNESISVMMAEEKNLLREEIPTPSCFENQEDIVNSELTLKESITNLVQKISNFLLRRKFECTKIEEHDEGDKSEMENYNFFVTRRKFSKNDKIEKQLLNPVITAYPESHRPRQPFMNQLANRNDRSTRIPNPPSYYTSAVTQDQHQPQLLLDPGSFQRERRPETQEPEPRSQDEVMLRPNYQPGQMMMMPNVALNFSFWAPYPENIPSNVPPCLAHLVAADSLFIIQQMDVIELFMNISEPNYYLIQNTSGQCLYYVYETTNLCFGGFCKFSRGLQLHVMDMYHNEIIYINKPCGCNNCFCCYPVLEVYSPPLVPVGAITQKFNLCRTEFTILDADENKVFSVYGPSCCIATCYGEVDFTIHALDWEETEIGLIRRQFGNITTTYFTNTDYYGISFPVDLDVRVKAVFLGALFLIVKKIFFAAYKPFFYSLLVFFIAYYRNTLIMTQVHKRFKNVFAIKTSMTH